MPLDFLREYRISIWFFSRPAAYTSAEIRMMNASITGLGRPVQSLRKLIGDLSDRDTRRSAFMYAFSSLAILLLTAFGVFHAVVGHYWMSAVNFSVLVLAALNMLVLHRRGNVRRAEDVSVSLLALVLLACLFGNVDGTGPFWFASFPLVACLLKGPKIGMAWMAALLLALATIIVLQEHNVLRTDTSSRGLVILMVSTTTVALVTGFYQIVLSDAEQQLAQRSRQLSREVLERQSVEQTLHRLEERLRFTLHEDGLTGLLNRSGFHDRLQHAIAIARRYHHQFAVVILDVVGFSDFNARHGHDRGDQVLRLLAERARACLREADSLARIGGDEFGLILWDLSPPQAASFALARLRRRLEEEFSLAGDFHRIAVKIGVALYPQDAWDGQSLLELCDSRRRGAVADEAAAPPQQALI